MRKKKLKNKDLDSMYEQYQKIYSTYKKQNKVRKK